MYSLQFLKLSVLKLTQCCLRACSHICVCVCTRAGASNSNALLKVIINRAISRQCGHVHGDKEKKNPHTHTAKRWAAKFVNEIYTTVEKTFKTLYNTSNQQNRQILRLQLRPMNSRYVVWHCDLDVDCCMHTLLIVRTNLVQSRVT